MAGLAAQKERALCAENDIKGYPTLKYWHTDPAAGDAPGGGASKYSVRTPQPNRPTLRKVAPNPERTRWRLLPQALR